MPKLAEDILDHFHTLRGGEAVSECLGFTVYEDFHGRRIVFRWRTVDAILGN